MGTTNSVRVESARGADTDEDRPAETAKPGEPRGGRARDEELRARRLVYRRAGDARLRRDASRRGPRRGAAGPASPGQDARRGGRGLRVGGRHQLAPRAREAAALARGG